jgi:hypothetical protein
MAASSEAVGSIVVTSRPLLDKIDFTVMGSPPLTGGSRAAARLPLIIFHSALRSVVRRYGRAQQGDASAKIRATGIRTDE